MAVATSLGRPLVVFSDLSRDFGAESNALLVFNAEVIHYELINLFTTDPGDVDFEPDLGSSLPNRLFEPKDGVTQFALEHDLFLAINKWMSQRISLGQDGVVVNDSLDARGFDVTLTYEILSLGIVVESNIQVTP